MTCVFVIGFHVTIVIYKSTHTNIVQNKKFSVHVGIFKSITIYTDVTKIHTHADIINFNNDKVFNPK
jgi:hypothetical protein